MCSVKGFQMSHYMARMSNHHKKKQKKTVLNVILILLSTFCTLKWGTMNKMAH